MSSQFIRKTKKRCLKPYYCNDNNKSFISDNSPYGYKKKYI